MSAAAVGGLPAARSAPVASLVVQPAKGWCQARLDREWRTVLGRSVVPLSRKMSIVPLAGGRDGRTFFASVWNEPFSGVARVDTRTVRLTRIKAFSDPVNDQAGGSFDGRWLVWREYHSLNNWDDFSVWAWDARTGRTSRIGRAAQGADGSFWSSTWRNPAVRNGIATWEQGSGTNGAGDIHVFDLRSGHDRIVRHGHPQGPLFLDERTIVWPESLEPGAPTVLRAVDTKTGKSKQLPRALRRLRGISALASDGRGIAYPAASFKSLWWSPSPSVKPRRLFATGSGGNVDNSVQIEARYLLFTDAPHAYLVDTATHRYLQVSRGGWGLFDNRALVFLPPSQTKASHAISDVLFVRLASLPPIPRCR
jgi:hypothetical protein